MQLALARPAQATINLEATLGQLRGLQANAAPATAAPLKVIQVSVGHHIRLIPVNEVLTLEAADTYTCACSPPTTST